MSAPGSFLVIVDKNGEVCDFIQKGTTISSIELSILRNDKVRPWQSPHLALLWNGVAWHNFSVNKKNNY